MNHTMLDGTVLQIEQRRLVRRRLLPGTIDPTHIRPHVLVSFSSTAPFDHCRNDTPLRISVGTRILVEGPVPDYISRPFEFLGGELWHPEERLVIEGCPILLDYIEVRDVDGGPPPPLPRPRPRFEKSPEARAESLARANDSYRDGRIAAVAEALFIRGAPSFLNDTVFAVPETARRCAEAAIAAARIFDSALEAEGLTPAPFAGFELVGRED